MIGGGAKLCFTPFTKRQARSRAWKVGDGEGCSYRRNLEARLVVGVVPQHGHAIAVTCAGAPPPTSASAAASSAPGRPASDTTCAGEKGSK
jgi:hypothetical protein